jgi:hypothetical protein
MYSRHKPKIMILLLELAKIHLKMPNAANGPLKHKTARPNLVSGRDTALTPHVRTNPSNKKSHKPSAAGADEQLIACRQRECENETTEAPAANNRRWFVAFIGR